MSLSLVDDYGSNSLREKAIVDSRTEKLRQLIQLSHATPDDEAQAALQLCEFLNTLTEAEASEVVNQRQIAAPLAHLLSKLLVSKTNPSVVRNAALILSQLFRDDTIREMLCKSGLHRLILLRIQDPKHEFFPPSRELLNDLLSCYQNILLDAALIPDVAQQGGLIELGKSLGRFLADQEERNVQREMLILCCMTNAMSHPEGIMALVAHELRNWIPSLILLLNRLKMPGDGEAVLYCLCAIENASRDPGLLHCIRASNGAEALERMKFSPQGGNERIHTVAQHVLDRLQFSLGGNDDDSLVLPHQFRFGGGKGTNSHALWKQQNAMGLLALLAASTLFCGMAVFVLFHLLHKASYF